MKHRQVSPPSTGEDEEPALSLSKGEGDLLGGRCGKLSVVNNFALQTPFIYILVDFFSKKLSTTGY
jgi:hypothetical protein